MKNLVRFIVRLYARLHAVNQPGKAFLPTTSVQKPSILSESTGSEKRESNSFSSVKYSGGELIEKVEDFLLSRFEFRFNRLSETVEYREQGNVHSPYLQIGKREMNRFCIDALKEGLNCWDRDVARFVNSTYVKPYHPFRHYLETLPPWDGEDRVESLARRVSDGKLWVEGFHRWMLAMVAQWSGTEAKYGNSVAPLLVSSRQGKQKSTFCKLLLPEPLQNYYTDSFELNALTAAEQKLSLFGLINLDEFDKFSPQKMAALKNLMQMATLNIRKAYQKNYAKLPRIASFIATSNRKELLTDPTGSRRFLCVEIEKRIDCSPIDHAQLYAQLRAELSSGARYWFTEEEELLIQENNAPFQRKSMAEDVFWSCFRRAETGEKCRELSAAEIFQQMKKKNPAAMRDASPTHFGRILTALGVEKRHTEQGNRYLVVSI